MVQRMALLAMVMATGMSAQGQPAIYRGSVHVEANLGGCVHGYAFGGGGGGGEAFLWKGLSAGVRASGNTFSDYGPIGLVHGEIGYHAVDRKRERGADPFFSFGLGVASVGTGSNRSGASASLGGGVNYWLSRRAAIRMEGRVISLPGDAVLVLQIGAAFR